MNKKPILVVKPSMPPLKEYTEELRDVWESGILTHTGPKHRQLQEKLEAYMGVRHVSLFANGHLALELGLKALDLQGEVITTPFTFASTTQAILRQRQDRGTGHRSDERDSSGACLWKYM